MSYQTFFTDPIHIRERNDFPLIQALIERYQDERPFAGLKVAFGHLLSVNSTPMIEALVAGGAELTIAEGHRVPATETTRARFAEHGIEIHTNQAAVQAADLFVDVNAILGRIKTPAGAAEVTRTGILHYQDIPCPVVSADDCQSKKIEGFFGTGDGFVRAWRQLRPDDPLAGKQVVQFGYGKIGRGVAHVARRAGLHVTVVDISPQTRQRAKDEGFAVVDGNPNSALEQALAQAEIVIAVTSIPKILSQTLPPDWLRANRPTLVNLGAEDEYGPAFADGEILGGRSMPLNFHLDHPTQNRYIDAPLAAHILALESLVSGSYAPGIHPLPPDMDRWLITNWQKHWPDEDLTGIAEDLGLA